MRFTCIVCLVLLPLALLAADLLAAPFVPTRDAQSVAFSPDGRQVVTGKSGMSNEEFPPRPHPTPAKAGVVQIWEVATGKMLRRIETFGDVRKVAFSPDGRSVAASRLYNAGGKLQLHEVRLWDVETGRTAHVFDRCHDFDFAPDGGAITLLSRSKCVEYDLTNYKKRQRFEPLGTAIQVLYAPDRSVIAGVVPDDSGFRIRVCDADSGQLLRESPSLDDPFYSLAFTPDARQLASGHAGGIILLWDVATMRPASKLEALTRGLVRPFISRDGQWLGGGCQDNGDVVIWHLASRQELARFTHEQGTFHTYYPRSPDERVRPERDPHRFVFAPTSDAFLCGCFGGIIRSLSGGQELRRFRD